jgi:hypothetical protein
VRDGEATTLRERGYDVRRERWTVIAIKRKAYDGEREIKQ